MTPDDAAGLLDVPRGHMQPFVGNDGFNNNEVDGYLCRYSDHRYGAMVIYRVNGQTTSPQCIYATPKLHYPFGRSEPNAGETRDYLFPAKVVKIEVYEKLDGTNICAYSYADAEGTRYLTFKTRLMPFLQDGRFGQFKSMWQELLDDERLRRLTDLARSGQYSLSFEMYGYRNPHLVVYDLSLSARLLFAVGQANGAVIPPRQITGDCPLALMPEATLVSPDDLIGFYNGKRAQAESRNRRFVDGEEERVEGIEGYVFYLLDEDSRWHQFKCKPESIEALHWTTDNIPFSIVQATAWNALESCDGKLRADEVAALLLEEFSAGQVNASAVRIEKAVRQVSRRIEWREQVQLQYHRTGLTFQHDGKPAVLRALLEVFPRRKMKSVFTALKEIGLVQ